MVVEDDEDTRELVRATLEHAGAQVEAVGSASEARREMLEESPDVLVSDIRMPEEDGYSLIQSLRTAGVTTPAIALTANARREDAEEARSAGFQIHLAKPIDATRLVEAVATLHEPFTESRGSRFGARGSNPRTREPASPRQNGISYFFLLGLSSAFRSPSAYCMPARMCARMSGWL